MNQLSNSQSDMNRATHSPLDSGQVSASLTGIDFLMMLAFAIIMGGFSYFNAQHIDPFFYDNQQIDVWFQSDIPIRFEMLTDYTSRYAHNKVHLLFAPLGFVPITLMRDWLGWDVVFACRVLISTVAAAWIGLLFWMLRSLGLPRLDASLFSLLGVGSAASIFWFAVPESFSFGSLGFLLTLGAVVLAESRSLSAGWYVLLGTLNMGITLTNGMAVFFAMIFNTSWLKTLFVLAVAFGLMGGLSVLVLLQVSPYIYLLVGAIATAVIWKFGTPIGDRLNRLGQSRWIPVLVKAAIALTAIITVLGSGLVVASTKLRGLVMEEVSDQTRFMLTDASGGMGRIIQAIIAHTFVMPEIKMVLSTWRPETGDHILLTQLSAPGSASVWGAIAVGLWMALLALGLWGFLTSQQHLHFRKVLGGLLLAQIALHLIYGEETFLYALHFAPLLMLVAAWSVKTRARPAALVLTGLLVLTMTANNLQQYQVAMADLDQLQAEQAAQASNTDEFETTTRSRQ